MRIDDEIFHGLACLIRLTDGEAQYWETPKAGRIQVTGAGMTWVELIPDHTNRVITVKYFPDGIAVYIDKYLDVIFTPEGDVVMNWMRHINPASFPQSGIRLL